MSGRELPILQTGQPLPASHYEQVTRAVNSIRQATGDKRYIQADLRGGALTIRWVGPTVGGVSSSVQRFRVKSIEADYMVCRTWDGMADGETDVFVARSAPDRIDYPADAIIFATQPIGGTDVTGPEDKPVEWLDVRLTVGQFFPVKITQTGGSNGSASTKASYTYTVKTLLDVELATDVAVVRPRENGALTVQAAGSYGVAFYDSDGALKLWDAGETYQLQTCS